MKIVLDANALMSALIKDSFAREIITKQKNMLFVPEAVFGTLIRYKQLILKKTNAAPVDLDELIKELLGYIAVLRENEYRAYIKKAKGIMDNIDPEDTVFIACALSLADSVIWSNGKHLKKQSKIEVCTTEELRKSL